MAFLWRRLGLEQRVAAVAAVLLIVSTIGPFSMVEAAMVLTGVGVLALLRARASGGRFHLPFGDGTVLIVAAGWYAVLILVRVLDRPLGQSALTLACAALLAAAGLRERMQQPPDDVRAPQTPTPVSDETADAAAPLRPDEDFTEPLRADEDLTQPLRPDEAHTRPLRPDEDHTRPLRRDEDETEALPPRRPRPPRPQDPPRPR